MIFTMMTVITDTRPKRALDKFRRLSALCQSRGRAGADVRLDRRGFFLTRPDEIVRFELYTSMTSALEKITTADPDRPWTVEEIARHVWIGGLGPLIVGSVSGRRR